MIARRAGVNGHEQSVGYNLLDRLMGTVSVLWKIKAYRVATVLKTVSEMAERFESSIFRTRLCGGIGIHTGFRNQPYGLEVRLLSELLKGPASCGVTFVL